MPMTPAMQKVVTWYVIGIVIAACFGWARIMHAGGVRAALRQPKAWRDMGYGLTTLNGGDEASVR